MWSLAQGSDEGQQTKQREKVNQPRVSKPHATGRRKGTEHADLRMFCSHLGGARGQSPRRKVHGRKGVGESMHSRRAWIKKRRCKEIQIVKGTGELTGKSKSLGKKFVGSAMGRDC